MRTFTSPLTGEGSIFGTLQYMAPEQLEGQDADARCDISSFGIVLYEMVAARSPFEGQNAAAILERDPPAPGDIAPPALDRLVCRCLAKDPEDRWQSACDLMDELPWIASVPAATAPASPQTSGTDSIWRSCARNRKSCRLCGSRWRPRRNWEHRRPSDIAGRAANPLLHLFERSVPALDSFSRLVDASPLPGTEGIGMFVAFWSPDSRSIAFFADGKLKRI